MVIVEPGVRSRIRAQHPVGGLFRRSRQQRTLSLALQGGGVQGAFTWGVLDALLEDGRFRFDGLSGASAGAMNAAAVAHGLACGGVDLARETLARFWSRVGRALPGEAGPAVSTTGSDSPPGVHMMLLWTKWLSPYQFNPLDINPLRSITEELFDFERIREASPVRLFVAATHANTGQLRLFCNHEISANALLASACLPMLHQAIVIDDEPYWDGAYSANPAVFPLIRSCLSDDILLVLLAPRAHPQIARTADEIRRRTIEMGFNSAFLREMRILALTREMARSRVPLRGHLERRLLANRFHMIDAHALSDLGAVARFPAHGLFLEQLRDAGRESARTWLSNDADHVGRRSTVDIDAMFSAHECSLERK